MIKKIIEAVSGATSDVLILAGCAVMIYATYRLSLTAALYMGGVMLIGAGVVYGLAKKGKKS
jgi:hypothetical protein